MEKGGREMGKGGREMGKGGREMGKGGREMGKGGREMGEVGRDGGRWEVVPSSTVGIGVCITLGNVGAEATDVITVYF